MSAVWLRKKDVEANVQGALVGPDPEVVQRRDGFAEPGLFVGQPRGFPLREHLLVLKTHVIPHAEGADSPTAIFLGGWDPHEGSAPATQRMLAFMYPYMGERARVL